MSGFEILVAAAALCAGAIASVSGFGIGSLLTPVLAAAHGMKLAVAAASIPHVCGTALRLVQLRRHLDWRVLKSFGVMSAAGGLAGALLHARASSPALSTVFGSLLLLAGLSELTGVAGRVRLGRRAAWIAGALSGLFGGLVGNQGGIRAAALLGFDLSKQAFVATATAIALAIDVARMPVYFLLEADGIIKIYPIVLIATAGVVVGTLAGMRLLASVTETAFRRLVAVLLIVLGAYTLAGLRSA